MAKTARKLSIKTICGDVKAIFRTGIADKKPAPIARIVGSVTSVKERSSRFDETQTDYCLIGQFRGINLLEPEIEIDSNKCYLPAFLAEQVAAQMAANQEDGGAIEFGVDILLVANEDSPVGYSYDAQSFVEAAPSPTLDRLLEAGGKLPKLPSPKKAA